MIEAVRTEIVDIHGFFERWLSAGTGSGDLSRVEAALDPEFEMVTPGGVVHSCASLLDALRQVGSRGSDFRIEIRHVAVHPIGARDALATYEEWQVVAGETRGRRSVAWFRTAAEAPCGVRWRFLQETLLPLPS